MTNSTLLIIGAAIVVLILLLVLLARTGRKPHEGPIAPPAPEPLPEPGAMTAPTIGTPLPEPAEPEPAVEEAEAGPPDPLTRMKGLGPKAEAVLNGLGITRYAQIAAWREADVARVDAQMGAFKGRIIRDRWVEQARLLSAGDTAAYEATFGKLG